MKRWIHASVDFDNFNATPGRIEALKDIDWQIEDDDIALLSNGTNSPRVYYQAIPIRKPIVKIEYADNSLITYIVTYEDGTRSKFGYKEGADSDEKQQRYYWTYLGKA